MRVLDDAIAQFETYINFPGHSGLERSTLLCLQMIAAAADKQEAVEIKIRQTPTPIMVTSIDRLLLSINPRSRRPDYLITIAKWVSELYFTINHCQFCAVVHLKLLEIKWFINFACSFLFVEFIFISFVSRPCNDFHY